MASISVPMAERGGGRGKINVRSFKGLSLFFSPVLPEQKDS